MYRVIQRFADGENGRPFTKDKGGAVYEVGAEYPIAGFEPDGEHIAYLLGCDFRGKGPVIEAVTDNVNDTGADEGQEGNAEPADEPVAATPEPETSAPRKGKK